MVRLEVEGGGGAFHLASGATFRGILPMMEGNRIVGTVGAGVVRPFRIRGGAPTLSLNQRLASRLRFARFREEWRNSRQATEKARSAGRGGVAHRSLRRLYRELFGLLKGHRLTLVAALATLSVATLLRFLPPAATKLVIDNVLLGKGTPTWLPSWLPVPSRPERRLAWLAGVVLVVSVVGALVGLRGRWLATRTSKRLQVTVRRRVFAHAARLPLHRIFQLKAGGAASLLREDADGVGELIFSMLYNPWRAIVQLVSGLAVLVWLDWRFLLGALTLVPVLGWTDRIWNRRLRSLYRAVRTLRQEIDASTAEAFGGMRVVRAFGRQRTEEARFVGESHLLARKELFAWWWSRSVEILWELLLPAASGAVLLYGGLSVLHGRLSLGDLMMFLVYLAMLLEPLAVLATSVTQLQNNLAGFDRVLDLLAEPREMAEQPGTLVARKRTVSGRITLRGVSFRYPGTDPMVLRDISLEVQPGETLALVGRSGAGKTTFCNLVARFYDPTSGTILLDGTNLRDIEVETYRRLLGIVEQDVFLFDGTVSENIAYASRRSSRSEVARAARLANADEFIEGLPEGYETVIGERGVKLSGGQRQRLAIARAVLADPRIFMLDEATSNLDTQSERLIQLGLESLMRDRTSFVIAHRLSTIQRADRILVLEAGEVVEIGGHDDLMARDGRYRDMVELQRLGAST
ncbi:MAG: ABC transporter ATP-binding protein [Isosphaeraceae bacterium]